MTLPLMTVYKFLVAHFLPDEHANIMCELVLLLNPITTIQRENGSDVCSSHVHSAKRTSTCMYSAVEKCAVYHRSSHVARFTRER